MGHLVTLLGVAFISIIHHNYQRKSHFISKWAFYISVPPPWAQRSFWYRMYGKSVRVKRADISRETVFFQESQYVCTCEPPGTLTINTKISHWEVQHVLGGVSKVLPLPDELWKIENFTGKGESVFFRDGWVPWESTNTFRNYPVWGW